MRIIFVGSSRFGLRCLKKVLNMPEINVVGVITNPETFSISYRPQGVKNVLYADFGPTVKRHNIPVWVMLDKMNDPALIAQVQKWAPELILVVGWYHMVPRSIRNIAPAAGLHTSLLPDYSGGAPLVWAIINDEKKTGISFFMLEDGVDSGPIIGQAEVPICFEDTIATLYARVEEAGLKLIDVHLPKIARGEAVYTPQDESRRRIMPQRSPEDGEIDWNWPARQIYNFVRAQTKPYPGAFTFFGHERVTIWKATLSDQLETSEQPPGTIVDSLADDLEAFEVKCGDGHCLRIHEVGLTNGATMSGSEFRFKRNVKQGAFMVIDHA